MTDQQTIKAPPSDEKFTTTIDDVKRARPKTQAGEKPKSKVEGTATGGFSLNDESPEPKKKVVRSTKLTGKHVEEMFEKFSSVAVYAGAHQDWYISGKEVSGYSDELAELLNKIPARYAQAAVDMTGYFAVGFGLYKTFQPRIEAEQKRKQVEKAIQNGKVPNEQLKTAA